MSGNFRTIGFIVYILFGLYLINSSFNFISMPDFIQSIDKWIVLIAGVLVIIGGTRFLKSSRSSSILP